MDIFLNIVYLILGFALLIKGADFFVEGASGIAKKSGMPSIVIGLTIVAIGTSLPELAVSIVSSIQGSTDLAVGNAVGSSIFNVLVALGIACIIRPVKATSSARKVATPFVILSAVALFVFASDKILYGGVGSINRGEGIILLCLFILYMFFTIWTALANQKSKGALFPDEAVFEEQKVELPAEQVESEPEEQADAQDVKKKKRKKASKEKKEYKLWVYIIMLIGGLGGVVGGGELVSMSSQFLALKAGMSEALVGLTIVALGTSLPELVTSIVAIKKGEGDIGIGNIMGSNICNTLLIIGTAGSISALPVGNAMFIDMLIMLGVTALLSFSCLKKGHTITRVEGIIYVCLYVGYLSYIIVRG